MKRAIKSVALLACVCVINGCTSTTDPMPAASSSTGRVSIERIGVISDPLAYGNRRGIYVIRDKEAGVEFIGVSGVGIAEVGHHQSGKSGMRDER